MKFLEKLQVIERVDQLIRMKATGSSNALAARLNVSRSTVYEILECMKQMGAEINYCKYRESYCYEKEKVLAIGFVNEKEIRGGKKMSFIGVPKSRIPITYL